MVNRENEHDTGCNESVQRIFEEQDGNKDPGEVAINIHVQRSKIRILPTLPQRSSSHLFAVIVYFFHLLFFCAFLTILSIAIARKNVRLHNFAIFCLGLPAVVGAFVAVPTMQCASLEYKSVTTANASRRYCISGWIFFSLGFICSCISIVYGTLQALANKTSPGNQFINLLALVLYLVAFVSLWIRAEVLRGGSNRCGCSEKEQLSISPHTKHKLRKKYSRRSWQSTPKEDNDNS